MTKTELFMDDTIVDQEGSWHFPTGKELLTKAKRLAKTGYTVQDYDGNVLTLEAMQARVKWCEGGGTCVMRGYHEVRELVDRKAKIYYVYFGRQIAESMWC